MNDKLNMTLVQKNFNKETNKILKRYFFGLEKNIIEKLSKDKKAFTMFKILADIVNKRQQFKQDKKEISEEIKKLLKNEKLFSENEIFLKKQQEALSLAWGSPLYKAIEKIAHPVFKKYFYLNDEMAKATSFYVLKFLSENSRPPKGGGFELG